METIEIGNGENSQVEKKRRKTVNNPWYIAARSLCLLVAGVMLLKWKDQALQLLVIMAGVVFLVPGLISVIGYFVRKERGWFPVLGAGSMLLGLVLLCGSKAFVNVVMYILGIVLVFIGLWQIVNYVATRRAAKVSGWLLAAPILVLVTGLIAIVKPFQVATLPLVIIAVGCILSGLNDIVSLVWWLVGKKKS